MNKMDTIFFADLINGYLQYVCAPVSHLDVLAAVLCWQFELHASRQFTGTQIHFLGKCYRDRPKNYSLK